MDDPHFTLKDTAELTAMALRACCDPKHHIRSDGPDVIIALANGQAFIFSGKEINDPVEFTD